MVIIKSQMEYEYKCKWLKFMASEVETVAMEYLNIFLKLLKSNPIRSTL